jgi:hypothetical protein
MRATVERFGIPLLLLVLAGCASTPPMDEDARLPPGSHSFVHPSGHFGKWDFSGRTVREARRDIEGCAGSISGLERPMSIGDYVGEAAFRECMGRKGYQQVP